MKNFLNLAKEGIISNKIKLYTCFGAKFISVIMSMLIPVCVSKIFNILVYHQFSNNLLTCIMVLNVLNIINIVMSYLYSYCYMDLQVRISYSICTNILNHIRKISLIWVEKRNSTEMSQYILKDVDVIVNFILMMVTEGMANGISLCFSIVVLSIINLKISILLGLICSLYTIGYCILKKRYVRSTYEMNQEYSKYFATVTKQIRFTRFILFQNAEKYFKQRLSHIFEVMRKKALANQKLSICFMSIHAVISLSAQLIIFLMGGNMVMHK